MWSFLTDRWQKVSANGLCSNLCMLHKKLHADLNVPDWSGKCELSFNLNKCKVLYKGKNSKHAHSMRSGNFVSEIDSLSTEKTL